MTFCVSSGDKPLSHYLACISLAILLLGCFLHENSSFAREMDQTDKQVAKNSVAMDHFIRGVTADKMDDLYRAVFEYQSALEADSLSPFLYIALAQDYVILGKVPQALDLTARALDIEADYKPALELRAGLLVNTDRWTEALTLYEHLARLDTTQVEYPFQLLRLYLMNRDFDCADAMYQRIAAVQGESKQLLFQVATALLLSDSVLRAIPYMELLSRMDTTDASVIYTLGTLYLLRSDTALAQTHFEKAVTLDSSIARFWMGLAMLQMDRGHQDAAEQILLKAIEKIPNDAGLWNLLGTCQNAAGKTDEAVRSLQETLRLDSTNYSAFGILALIYDRMDSIEKVQDLYERALQLSDSAAVFLNNYAYSLSEHGKDLEHAKVMAERACAEEPTNASFLDTMGWIFFKMGDHKSAIRWLKKAQKAEPKSAPILEHLGDVYQDSGAPSKARAYYRKALKWDPHNETLRRKLGL
jgi:tetratricopeptide (TPR) repeat protein